MLGFLRKLFGGQDVRLSPVRELAEEELERVGSFEAFQENRNRSLSLKEEDFDNISGGTVLQGVFV